MSTSSTHLVMHDMLVRTSSNQKNIWRFTDHLAPSFFSMIPILTGDSEEMAWKGKEILIRTTKIEYMQICLNNYLTIVELNPFLPKITKVDSLLIYALKPKNTIKLCTAVLCRSWHEGPTKFTEPQKTRNSWKKLCTITELFYAVPK